ncbi:AraC family transcriptional regulator, partial [Streptomyces sp. NPDC049577]
MEPAARPGTPQARPQRIALVAFPGIRTFDIAVITEVWGVDRTARGAPPF